MLEQTGLVLEGGGMRGVYTAGVLEVLLENNIEFPYVIGVSAGACNAASFLSRQHGRNKKVNIEYAAHPEYLSFRNYIKKKELFGMDFVFGTIPNELVPYDYAAFHQNPTEFMIGTTDCHTGKPLYLSRNDYKEDLLLALRASSSLPLISPMVMFNGKELMDGGITDSIPLKQAEKDGFDKNVVILTRNEGYYKKPSKFTSVIHYKYGRFYPNLVQAIENRYDHYNQAIKEIERKEKAGEIFVIRPTLPLKVGRVEKNQKKLKDLYMKGYNDGKKALPTLLKWSEKNNVPS
ncbi:patatin [Bacillus coahuilensis m2-6]|uniref:patatin-like phospholipase family protein n=1 Tax=Bacillus coahuilensis TaxID=408580 RepID=UPI000750056D|nr:patatin family protein [Bacillus coahuilensis]KUP08179.1 patatin [Bacillus coahuilensis m2-6]